MENDDMVWYSSRKKMEEDLRNAPGMTLDQLLGMTQRHGIHISDISNRQKVEYEVANYLEMRLGKVPGEKDSKTEPKKSYVKDMLGNVGKYLARTVAQSETPSTISIKSLIDGKQPGELVEERKPLNWALEDLEREKQDPISLSNRRDFFSKTYGLDIGSSKEKQAITLANYRDVLNEVLTEGKGVATVQNPPLNEDAPTNPNGAEMPREDLYESLIRLSVDIERLSETSPSMFYGNYFLKYVSRLQGTYNIDLGITKKDVSKFPGANRRLLMKRLKMEMSKLKEPSFEPEPHPEDADYVPERGAELAENPLPAGPVETNEYPIGHPAEAVEETITPEAAQQGPIAAYNISEDDSLAHPAEVMLDSDSLEAAGLTEPQLKATKVRKIGPLVYKGLSRLQKTAYNTREYVRNYYAKRRMKKTEKQLATTPPDELIEEKQSIFADEVEPVQYIPDLESPMIASIQPNAAEAANIAIVPDAEWPLQESPVNEPLPIEERPTNLEYPISATSGADNLGGTSPRDERIRAEIEAIRKRREERSGPLRERMRRKYLLDSRRRAKDEAAAAPAEPHYRDSGPQVTEGKEYREHERAETPLSSMPAQNTEAGLPTELSETSGTLEEYTADSNRGEVSPTPIDPQNQSPYLFVEATAPGRQTKIFSDYISEHKPNIKMPKIKPKHFVYAAAGLVLAGATYYYLGRPTIGLNSAYFESEPNKKVAAETRVTTSAIILESVKTEPEIEENEAPDIQQNTDYILNNYFLTNLKRLEANYANLLAEADDSGLTSDDPRIIDLESETDTYRDALYKSPPEIKISDEFFSLDFDIGAFINRTRTGQFEKRR